MTRPPRERWVGWRPAVQMFKPAGIPARELETQCLTVDEVEALRLVDAEGLDQQGAAECMKVSRATVGRILESARRKTALALVHGHALAIEESGADIQYYGRGRGGMGRGRGMGKGRGRGMGKGRGPGGGRVC